MDLKPLRALLWGGVFGLLASCTSSIDETSSAPTSSASATTTTIPNRPPILRAPTIVRAELGDEFTDAIISIDPDGDDVVVGVGPAPPGFTPTVNSRGRITGFAWRPTSVGEWDVAVTSADAAGLTTEETIHLLARSPRAVDLLLSMGDSIAAGFGRDRTDFLGTDDCFRSESDSYATLASELLIDAGALSESAEVLLVSCAEASSSSLGSETVRATDTNGDFVGREDKTQLEWARDLNPTIVTLTVGANDVGLFELEDVLLADAGDDPSLAMDTMMFDERIEVLGESLGEVLEILVTTTDAHIAVTTYYDPTASDPQGIEGCEGSCFVEVMDALMLRVNRAILGAIDSQPQARLSVVRLDAEQDVWEASNGSGPDFLRDGLGPLQGIVDRFTQGSNATCASSGRPELDLVSSLDCLHPNVAGHREIAARVTEVLLSI